MTLYIGEYILLRRRKSPMPSILLAIISIIFIIFFSSANLSMETELINTIRIKQLEQIDKLILEHSKKRKKLLSKHGKYSTLIYCFDGSVWLVRNNQEIKIDQINRKGKYKP